jgi:hypothetical protein
MTVRRYTWAEFHAWRRVTERVDRARRAAAVIDGRVAAHASGEDLKAHLESLHGEP